MVLLLWGCSSSGTLSTLTYNVAGLPQAISSSDPERFIPQMAPFLDAYELVLVQEDFAYHDELVADLTLPNRSVPSVPTDELINDGLNRFSSLVIDPVERTRWRACNGLLDEGSDCLAEKGFSLGRVFLDDRTPIWVVNHHADAGSGPDDEGARADNFAQLAEAISGLDGAVLLAGDTNLRPESRPADATTYGDFLDATGLQDVCTVLGCPEERIDRVFIRSGEVTLTPVSWAVDEMFRSPEGEPLSDHEAVAVSLAWAR